MFKYISKCLGLIWLIAASTQAATIVGPSPYLALSDMPDGLYPAGAIVHFEDFESPDGPWEVCFSVDNGQRIGPKHVSGDNVPVTDSVDSDDSAIDGDGTMGSSWFTPRNNLTITYDDPTSVASFVITDGASNASSILIEVFGDGGDLLLSEAYDSFLDDVFTGTTQEDRFFGITAMGTDLIQSVRISIDNGTGIEIDHVQFIKEIPEPGTAAMLFMGAVGIAGLRRRRRR